MPLDPTTPPTLESRAKQSASKVQITHFSVDVVNARAELQLCHVVAGELHPIPGIFHLYDVATGEGGTVTIGGKSWTVAEGSHFSDNITLDHAGADIYNRVKTGLYKMLTEQYTDLVGTVS